MNLKLRFFLSFILAVLAGYSNAQAPVVTYSSPKTYIIDTTITPLAPSISAPPIIASGFHNSNGIAVDAAGNVYVADPDNNQVDKIPVGGGPMTTVGTGLSYPYDVTVDAAGNIYVADFGSGKLKKILASTGATIVLSSSDVNLANVAIDPAGNIYTTDLFGSNNVNKFPAGGGAMTTVGSGFVSPFGIAVDASGNIYVADESGVKKMPPGGGTPVNIGTGFSGAGDVAVDASGNVFVTTDEAVKEILASNGATITVASFFPVSDIAADASGNVYMSDDDNVVRKLKPISSFSITPTLPAGFAFDIATGTISGAPTTLNAATNYKVAAHYNSGTDTATVNIAVVAPPPIEVSVVTGSIVACAGMPSESPHLERFSVSGNHLSANIIVTAPAAFEISLTAASGYSSNLSLTQSGGTVNTTTIYVRAAAQSAGTISGNVILASTGVANQIIAVTGIINALPTVAAVSNQSVVNGIATTAVNFTASAGISWTNDSPGIGLPASGSGNIPSFTAVNTGTSGVTATITATPVSAGLLYAVGTQPNGISVINTNTNTVTNISSVSISNAASNLASVLISADGSFVYVIGENVITKINTSTNTIASTIPIANPQGIVLSNDGSRLYVSTGQNIVVINAINSTVVTTITLGVDLSDPVLSHDGKTIYIADNYSNQVYAISTSTNSVVSTIPAGPSENGIAISLDDTRLYVANGSQTNTVSVVDIATKSIIATVPTSIGSYGVVISPDGSRVYVASIGYGYITVINTANNSAIANIPVNNLSSGIAISADGSRLYVTSNTTSGGAVLTINTATNTIISTILVSSYPGALVYATAGGTNCGGTPTTFTITVKPPSASAYLSGLVPSLGSLTPAFSATTTSYAVNLANSHTSITVQPTAAGAGAKITVNGNAVTSGTSSPAIPLAVGSNAITIAVTSADGTADMTYTLTVNRAAPLSTNANLANLVPSLGGLTPAFSAATTSYTDNLANSHTSISVQPTLADPTAKITVNGTAVTSGAASASIPLTVGANVISIVVTAQDGVTKTSYTLTVNRAAPLSTNANLANLVPSLGALTPAFSATNTSYAEYLANSHTSITVQPTVADATAKVTVNGVAVTSGAFSPSIPLAVGANPISIVVTAQDGVTKMTYTITVNRAGSSNANLANLVPSLGSLSPSFAAATTGYVINLANSHTSITVKPTVADATATVAVNGTPVASGTNSADIPLSVGSNLIHTVVTAQDGVTKVTYTVTVNRAAPPSSNANLASLVPSLGGLTPAFATATTSYADNLANSHASIMIKPTVADATATVTVNGTTVTSGTYSAAIPLAVGNNAISTIVTAQDGITKVTYTINVNRATGNSLYVPADSMITTDADVVTDGILVHPGVSPNGDGINDIFTIDGINAYPENKVTIMGRNGNVIFEANGYDNQTKFFDGHSSKNGSLQLPGTYFYSLEYSVNGKIKQTTGFLVLKY